MNTSHVLGTLRVVPKTLMSRFVHASMMHTQQLNCCLQAQEMQQKGKAVLVDVREQKYFNQEHAANCLHVGLFRPVEGRTRLDNLKRLAMAGFAMEATGMVCRPRQYLMIGLQCCPGYSQCIRIVLFCYQLGCSSLHS